MGDMADVLTERMMDNLAMNHGRCYCDPQMCYCEEEKEEEEDE